MTITVGGGAGAEIGDYITTERSSLGDGKALLLANGTIPDAGTYPLLTAVLSDTEKLTGFNEGATNTVGRSWTVQADGLKGWYGEAGSTDIFEVDLTTGIRTTVFTATLAIDGFFDGCSSDDGQDIYFLGYNVTTDDAYSVSSHDGGSSWTELVIGAGIYSNFPSIGISTINPRGTIECNAAGTDIVVILTMDDLPAETIIFKSTDSATSYAEILTPRQTLTSPDTLVFDTFISRDLSTIGVFSYITANQRWLSVGGGALSDVDAAYPTTGSEARTAISNNGTVAFSFRAVENNFPTVYFSVNNMVSWTAIDLSIPLFEPSSAMTIMSAQFHPTDNDLVYMIIKSGVNTNPLIVHSLKLSTEELIVLGNFNPKSGTGANAGVYQLQSSLRLNGSDILYMQADGSSKDFTGVATITNGKFIADASTEPLTYKIVADAP